MVTTVEKGDELEKKFYQYLLDQKNRGDLVFGGYLPHLYEIHWKDKHYSKDREGNVTFDIVIEFFREEAASPHWRVVFECKNYESGIPESEIRDFSDKLSDIFPHSAKGVIVFSSRLQSGAETLAKNRGMGIVKYDEHGIEIIAERKSGTYAEDQFVEAQIFTSESAVKSMKFSAYYDGRFFGSIDQFLARIDPNETFGGEFPSDNAYKSVPYVSVEVIRKSAQGLLDRIHYEEGLIDLERICSMLSLDLQFTDKTVQDGDGNVILGSANFDRKRIEVNSHDDDNRERFTIAHEVGHFCLDHGRYLRSEYILGRDLIIDSENENAFNYERLEYQANIFTSNLLLPEDAFLRKTAEYREKLEIRDRGHAYIFVDDQPWNYGPYNQLLSILSFDFGVSKSAIEIRLRKLGLLTDQRNRPRSLSF